MSGIETVSTTTPCPVCESTATVMLVTDHRKAIYCNECLAARHLPLLDGAGDRGETFAEAGLSLRYQLQRIGEQVRDELGPTLSNALGLNEVDE